MDGFMTSLYRILGLITAFFLAFIGYNVHKINSVETITTELINDIPDITIDFVSKDYITGSLSYQLSYTDNPLTAIITPTIIGSEISYELKGLDDLLNKQSPSEGEFQAFIQEVKGRFNLKTSENTLKLTQYGIQTPFGQLSSDYTEFTVRAPKGESIALADVISLNIQNLNFIDIYEFKKLYILNEIDDESFKVSAKLTDFDINATNLLNFITQMTGADMSFVPQDIFLLFPFSIETSIDIDQEIINQYSNVDQYLSDEANANYSINVDSPIANNKTKLHYGLKLNEDDFDFGLTIDSNHMTNNVDTYNRFLDAYTQLLAISGMQIGYIDKDLLEENLSIRAFGKVSKTSEFTDINITLQTLDRYTQGSEKEIFLKAKLDEIIDFNETPIFLRLNGEYLDPDTPIELTKILTLKSNHKEKLKNILQLVTQGTALENIHRTISQSPEEVTTLDVYIETSEQ